MTKFIDSRFNVRLYHLILHSAGFLANKKVERNYHPLSSIIYTDKQFFDYLIVR